MAGGSRPGPRVPRTSKEMTSRESPEMRSKVGGKRKATDKKQHGIGLRAVSEVLLSYGLNPAEEIVKALQGGKLDAKTQAMVGLSLLEYISPKLKAIEHKGSVQVDAAQLDAQLAALLEKAKT